jgi:hypothetical protein
MEHAFCNELLQPGICCSALPFAKCCTAMGCCYCYSLECVSRMLAAVGLWLAARSEAPASAVVICFHVCHAHGVLSGFHSEFCMPLPYGARNGQLTAGATQARKHLQLLQCTSTPLAGAPQLLLYSYCHVSHTMVQLFGAVFVGGVLANASLRLAACFGCCGMGLTLSRHHGTVRPPPLGSGRGWGFAMG